MDNAFNKTCYFFFENDIYKGTILKNKGNKYVIKSQSKLHISNKCFSDIIYIKKEEVIFKESDIRIQNFINDMSNKYFVDVLTNSFTKYGDSLQYHLFVQKLIKFFPKNETIIEMKKSLKKNYPV